MKQKFDKHDHVMIAKDLGPHMIHFKNNCEAIVEYTYAERYSGDDIKSYSLHLKGHGSVSWYEEHQLTLIEKNRSDLFEAWKKEEQDEEILKSDVDWIFENSKNVLSDPHGASIKTLAKMLGIQNLWGKNGEGFVYYQNAMSVILIAKPFLDKADKKGWIEFCDRRGK